MHTETIHPDRTNDEILEASEAESLSPSRRKEEKPIRGWFIYTQEDANAYDRRNKVPSSSSSASSSLAPADNGPSTRTLAVSALILAICVLLIALMG